VGDDVRHLCGHVAVLAAHDAHFAAVRCVGDAQGGVPVVELVRAPVVQGVPVRKHCDPAREFALVRRRGCNKGGKLMNLQFLDDPQRYYLFHLIFLSEAVCISTVLMFVVVN
jgi:hypothetical protein